jgi:hypothetical protein
MDVRIDDIGGRHPTRATGTIGQHRWAFESRFGIWTLTVSSNPEVQGPDDWWFTGEDAYLGEVPPEAVERILRHLLSRPESAWFRLGQYGDILVTIPLRSIP